MGLHSLIGVGDVISGELVTILRQHQQKVRVIAPFPQHVAGAECITASIFNYEQLVEALHGSSVVYLLAVFPVDQNISADEGLLMMRNVINACKERCARLVFLDQACVYGKATGIITETSLYAPCSKLGNTRMVMASVLEKEMPEGILHAAIARTSDVFGPGHLSFSKINRLVFGNLIKGKRAQWPLSAGYPRTYNYSEDIARCLYILGDSRLATGRIWHLPAATPAISPRQFVQLAARYMLQPGEPEILSPWFLRAKGLLDPWFKGLYDTACEGKAPFIFSGFNFEETFDFSPTPYHLSIEATANWYLHHSGLKP